MAKTKTKMPAVLFDLDGTLIAAPRFVVGDSVWGLLAAGRKGALGVGMLPGGYGEEELPRAEAFRIYADPQDMLPHLEQFGLPGKS